MRDSESVSHGEALFALLQSAGPAVVEGLNQYLVRRAHRVDAYDNPTVDLGELNPALVGRLLERTGTSLDDVDLFITHQGNALMVRAVLEDLGIDPAKAVNDVAEHGNTSGATVAIALDEALRDGRLGPGKRALLTSVGAGYTFGAALHDF